MNAIVTPRQTQTHASPIHGPCRGRWSWDGETFTAAGVWVPPEVIRADDELHAEGLPLPPDEEVLDDMTPILDPAVLPAGSHLSAPEPKIDRAKLDTIKARMRASVAAAQAPAAGLGDPADAIELAVARREAAEKDERIAAAAAENAALMDRLRTLEAKVAQSGTPDQTAPVTPAVAPADPLDVTGGTAKGQTQSKK
jgi:hypothetical protein